MADKDKSEEGAVFLPLVFSMEDMADPERAAAKLAQMREQVARIKQRHDDEAAAHRAATDRLNAAFAEAGFTVPSESEDGGTIVLRALTEIAEEIARIKARLYDPDRLFR